MTIDALLEKFLTGTEMYRTYGQNMSKLVLDAKPRPLVEMCLDSPTEKAKKIKRINDNKSTTNQSTGNPMDTFMEQLKEWNKGGDDTSNYLSTVALIKAANLDILAYTPIVWWLLSVRAGKVETGYADAIELHEKMCKQWIILKSQSLTRSRQTTETQRNNNEIIGCGWIFWGHMGIHRSCGGSVLW